MFLWLCWLNALIKVWIVNLVISSVWMDWIIKIPENCCRELFFDSRHYVELKVTIDGFIAMWKMFSKVLLSNVLKFKYIKLFFKCFFSIRFKYQIRLIFITCFQQMKLNYDAINSIWGYSRFIRRKNVN